MKIIDLASIQTIEPSEAEVARAEFLATFEELKPGQAIELTIKDINSMRLRPPVEGTDLERSVSAAAQIVRSVLARASVTGHVKLDWEKKRVYAWK